VGGWNSETLAEDLDLSIRLRLRGWRFVYDSGVLCPGEIPTSFAVLRQQQFRWASGFAGCLKKHLRELIETGELSLLQKTEALIYLTSYAASPLIALGVVTAVLYCLVFPLDFVLHGFRSNALAAFTVFCSALIYTAPFALFTLAVVRSSKGLADRTKRSVDLAYLGVLSVAIFLTSSKAILQGLLNKATYFYRTPKHESARTGA
jgi:cellulose synthase/poly-beta-1,6-N-acetylglucosamine synthase-like glycosyltransferase